MAKCERFLVLVAYAASVVSGAVLSIDEPVLNELPAEVLYRVCQPLKLKCGVNSAEKIEYAWHKNGKPLDGKVKDGTLFIEKTTVDTEGKYQCFAQTQYGTASSRVVSVKRAYIIVPKVTRRTHKPKMGKPFKLDCRIPKAYPAPKIEWVKTKASGHTETILNQRITTGPDGALYFSNATTEDASEDNYVCRAITPAADKPVVLAKHLIEEVVPGSGSNGELVAQYLSRDVVARAGDVTMIYCIYGGTPLAHPDWYFGVTNVNNSPSDRITRYNRSAGKRLLIKDTYLSDQGTYTCKVDNEVGTPQEHSIRLTVVSAPKFLKKPEPRLRVKEGEDVTIRCKVSGVKKPLVTWTYNAVPLELDERVHKGDNGLTIRNVQSSDTGYYGCRAVNAHGDIYAETLLNVI